jgi:photosystem II stability/assembly factor-like uncharacterized protein
MHTLLDAEKKRYAASIAVLAIALTTAGTALNAQSSTLPHWVAQSSGTTAELRGLAVVTDKVAWASGTGGTVVRTIDGGTTWQVTHIEGADSLDLRDINAVDERIAWVLSIGQGPSSRIYRTRDAGATWTLQFTNPEPKAFYDAIAFWDSDNGMAMSDPVNGYFRIITTKNGGRSWEKMPTDSMPPALENEGGFAASGTCLIVADDGVAYFGTGGAVVSRVFRTKDSGKTWKVAETPIVAGNASAGIFSLALRDSRGKRAIAVGGDYRKPAESTKNVAGTNDSGADWFTGTREYPHGYRSGVAYVPGTDGRMVIATGLSGSDISSDSGASWKLFDQTGYNTVGFADNRTSGWAVGPQGRIAKLVW